MDWEIQNHLPAQIEKCSCFSIRHKLFNIVFLYDNKGVVDFIVWINLMDTENNFQNCPAVGVPHCRGA